MVSSYLLLYVLCTALLIPGQSLRSQIPRSPRTQASQSVRQIAQASLGILGGLVATQRANAFFESEGQLLTNDVSKYQRPVSDLVCQLQPTEQPNAVGVYAKSQMLKGGSEDSAVVLVYLSTYINPLQKAMVKAVNKIDIPENNERLKILPGLMLGHSLELKQAIDSGKAEDQLKESLEVQETLQEFLKLASAKYDVTMYVEPSRISDKDLFGPLGCEFYGKKRIPGSNACAPPEDENATANKEIFPSLPNMPNPFLGK